MSSGRPFHSFRSTEANDHSPIVTGRDARTVSWLEADDRSRLRDGIGSAEHTGTNAQCREELRRQ